MGRKSSLYRSLRAATQADEKKTCVRNGMGHILDISAQGDARRSITADLHKATLFLRYASCLKLRHEVTVRVASKAEHDFFNSGSMLRHVQR